MRTPRRDQGAVSTEYALLALFIAIAAITGIALLGGAVLDLFESTDEVPWNTGP